MKKLILLGILFLFSSVAFSQYKYMGPGILKESYLIVKVKDSIVFSSRVTEDKKNKTLINFQVHLDASIFSSSELLELFQNYGARPYKVTSAGKPDKNLIMIDFVWDFGSPSIPPAKMKSSSIIYSSSIEGLTFPEYIKIYVKEVEIKLD